MASEWGDVPEEEESSFISMADMMVGLLLIFIILLTYYVLRSQQEIKEADRVSKTEQAAVVARGIVLNRIRDRVDDDRIEFDETTGTIRFSEQVLTFEPGRDVIPNSAKPVLTEMAGALAETLPCLAHLEDASVLDCSWITEAFLLQELVDRDLGDLVRYRPDGERPLIWIDGVYVEGHTDCTKFSGADPDFRNWILGAQRAGRTYLFLTEARPELSDIFSKDPLSNVTATSAHRILGVASYADRRPARDFGSGAYPPDHLLAADADAACDDLASEERGAEAVSDVLPQNRRNRRIDIRIAMGWTSERGGS